jgi:oligoribonuclease (3'-5' exoribonuclease)
MPTVLKEVHYRVADVSSTRVQMAAITGEDWEYKKQKGHRAAKDVDETIAEYRFLWKKFMDWTTGVDFVDVWELPKL